MGNILSSREKKIIVSIINSHHGITLQDISTEIGVSRRTVLREMSSIYEWFEKREFNVERHSSKGIFLEITESDKLELLNELNEEQIVHYYNKKERTLYIITELLMNKEALKLSYFSTVLQVSEASISTDLNRVEEWLSNYKLKLERKQGYGILVEGRELDKRRALVNIMYEMLDGNQLRDAVQRQIGMESQKVKVTSKIRLSLLNMIDVDTISVIENAISDAEKDMGFKLAESSYIALAVHLALALKRIMNDETITIRPEILDDLRLDDEYIVASKLIQTLRSNIDINIPEDEVGYVTLHLKGARYKNGLFESKMIKFDERVISNYELTSIVTKMISKVGDLSGYNLKEVDSLLIGLIDHLRPAISRIELNLDIRNPLLKKIKNEYKELFEMSKQGCEILQEELGIILPESEIGYIAMHIGSAIEQIKNKKAYNDQKYNIIVTCISGIGTSKMLAERIKKEFDNLNIVEVYSSTSIKSDWLKRHDIDLILSTVHFVNDTVPVLTVNPLLPDKDIKKINQKLNSLTIVNSKTSKDKSEDLIEILQITKNYSEAMIEVLQNIHLESGLKCHTYDELLKLISSKITSNNQVLYKDFLEREKIGKIVFDEDKVSFLHTRSNSVDKVHVGVFRNKYIINNDGHKYDTVLVLVAPHEVNKQKLEILGEISARVVSEENFLHDLRYKSEESLYKQFQSFLHKFYNKKTRK